VSRTTSEENGGKKGKKQNKKIIIKKDNHRNKIKDTHTSPLSESVTAIFFFFLKKN
jgi:hypothetical protein